MKAIFLFSFFSVFSLIAKAQTDPITQVYGAKNQSLGNIRIFDNSSWSHFNNPGGLAKNNQAQLAAGYDHRFGLSDLSSVNLSAAVPFNFGVVGLGISKFGGKLFNQQILGISFSNQLGIVSIGGKLDWFQTQIEGFGTGNAAIFSLGGIIELGPDFSMGATISNLNRARIGKNSDQRIPTGISLGINYHPFEQLQVFGEVEKDILINPIYKFGLAYSLKDWMALRTGVNSNPGRLFFGLGINAGKFYLDLAFSQVNPLGSTNHVSLTFDLDP